MCRCVVALHVGLFFIMKNLIKQDFIMLKQKSVTVENGVQIFNNQEFGNVKVNVIDNEPWFCLGDVT